MLERDFRFCTGNLLLINIISCDKNKFSNRPNWWPQCLTPRTSHGSTLTPVFVFHQQSRTLDWVKFWCSKFPFYTYGTNLFLSTIFTRHNSNRPTLTTVCICDKGSKQSGKVEVLPFLAVCHLSGFRSKFWILLLCLTAFASPHLSWINFDNDLCLRSTMRTMGCCL